MAEGLGPGVTGLAGLNLLPAAETALAGNATLGAAGKTALLNAGLGGSIGKTVGDMMPNRTRPTVPSRPGGTTPQFQPTANQFRRPVGGDMRLQELLAMIGRS
jgi:hypothetical protein